MSTKIIRNRGKSIRNRTTLYSGKVTYDQLVSVNSQHVSAEAMWSRRKPARPKDTPMIIYDNMLNDNEYRDMYPGPNGMYGKEGTLNHVYPGTTDKTETIDSGGAAMTRALNKLTGDRATFGESLVETRTTLDMIRNRIRLLWAFGRALRNGKLDEAARLLKFDPGSTAKEKLKKMSADNRIASGYLEFMFGILPVVNDIENGLKIYAEGLATRGQKIESRSGGHRSSKRRENWQQSSHGLRTGKASVKGRVTNERARNLNSQGLLNVPLEVWNALPFSFVFDWFVPVGTLLGAMSGSAGLAADYSQVSVRTAEWRKRQSTGSTDIYSRQITVTRFQPIIGLPSVSVLASSAAGSWGQVVSMAALAAQQIQPRAKQVKERTKSKYQPRGPQLRGKKHATTRSTRPR